MGWFKRFTDGIQTATKNKKEAPDGLWYKCKSCNETITVKELRENTYVCPKCDYHTRIGSYDYFEIIYDGKYEILFDELRSKDFLSFTDLKPYSERLDQAIEKTDLTEAMTVAVGKINGGPTAADTRHHVVMEFGTTGHRIDGDVEGLGIR